MIGRVNVGGGGASEVKSYSVRGWCQTVGLPYAFLENITEVDMRKLMTMHDSVDYFIEWYSADRSMITDFISNVHAMKWIGLRDYICDQLMKASDFRSKALASTNWKYILKDCVPVMSSNTTPFGQASNYEVFDGTSSAATSKSFSYEFHRPICIRKVVSSASGGILSASNDGSNYVTISNPLNNSNYYLHYKVIYTQATAVSSLQLYGRELNEIEASAPADKPYMTVDNVVYTVDYSERTNRAYLYDRGISFVEFDTLQFGYDSYTEHPPTYEADRMRFDWSEQTAGNGSVGTKNKINLGQYSSLGIKYLVEKGTSHVQLRAISSTDWTQFVAFKKAMASNDQESMDLSQVTNSNYLFFMQTTTPGNMAGIYDIYELWLE